MPACSLLRGRFVCSLWVPGCRYSRPGAAGLFVGIACNSYLDIYILFLKNFKKDPLLWLYIKDAKEYLELDITYLNLRLKSNIRAI